MGRPARYDWEQWFGDAAKNGGKVIRAGVHFPDTIRPESMRQQLYVNAKRYGYRVSLTIRDDFEGVPLGIVIFAIKVADLGAYFTGEQGTVQSEDLTMKPYEFVEMLKAEGLRRGLGVKTAIDDFGNVHYRCQAPS